MKSPVPLLKWAALAVPAVLAATGSPAWAQVHDTCVYGVPEIDPSALRSALALLVGGTLVLVGRRRGR